jgi:hypothetical protein
MLVIGKSCTSNIALIITKQFYECVNRTKIRERSRNNIYINIYCWEVLSLTQVHRCKTKPLHESERGRINKIRIIESNIKYKGEELS